MNDTTTLLWLREDLRLADNPALQAALEKSAYLLPVYIHAPQEAAERAPGAASRWWLHHSLRALAESLRAHGSDLLLRRGDSLAVLRELCAQTGARRVVWNRQYEPALIARDSAIKTALREAGIECRSFNAKLLREPWEVQTRGNTPYRVFTPYWRAHSALPEPPPPGPAPARLPPCPPGISGENLDALALLPEIPWDGGLQTHWEVGEAAAQARLRDFLSNALARYPEQRDRPDELATSRLAPYLHFGEIGPRQIWHALRPYAQDPAGAAAAAAFLRQIIWRDFAYQLLYHFPHTLSEPLNPRFAAFPWYRGEDAAARLRAWQRGRTGYPIIDAGMRELWHTGFMHNRVRMLAASFLTKNLRLPWQLGEAWFWDTLVDADSANNVFGWQWTAGCGADAAPYFRIFNPISQGEKFDPQGAYIRRWVPELAALPDAYLNQPWAAPPLLLQAAGLRLGEHYPHPIVAYKASREAALAAYAEVKAQAGN